MKHFTLIELIASVILLGLVAVASITIVSAAADHKNQSRVFMGKTAGLSGVCEKIVCAYQKKYMQDLAGLKESIDSNGGDFGGYTVIFNNFVQFSEQEGVELPQLTAELSTEEKILKVVLADARDFSTNSNKGDGVYFENGKTTTLFFIDEREFDELTF